MRMRLYGGLGILLFVVPHILDRQYDIVTSVILFLIITVMIVAESIVDNKFAAFDAKQNQMQAKIDEIVKNRQELMVQVQQVRNMMEVRKAINRVG